MLLLVAPLCSCPSCQQAIATNTDTSVSCLVINLEYHVPDEFIPLWFVPDSPGFSLSKELGNFWCQSRFEYLISFSCQFCGDAWWCEMQTLNILATMCSHADLAPTSMLICRCASESVYHLLGSCNETRCPGFLAGYAPEILTPTGGFCRLCTWTSVSLVGSAVEITI